MFNLMENMPQHRFIPFCVAFRQNRETPYSRYFVSPPAGQDGVYFGDFKMSLVRKLAHAGNSVYHWEARRKLERLIRDEKPDLVFCLNSVYFSDSIIDACRKHGIPVVCRLSDFHRVCASYHLYRDGQPCEECIERGLSRAVVNRCGGYQRSHAAAFIKVAGMWLSRLRRLHDCVDYYVAPSEFTRQKMIQGGFEPAKVVHIPTMAAVNAQPSMSASQEILFAGRLSPEKGIDTLLAAFGLLKNTGARLSIAGDDTSDYARALKDSVPAELKRRVMFHGFMDAEQIKRLYERALCVVVPSVCYENQPNAVLEGMAHGRAAVASDLGSLKEMVDDGLTGFRFRAGDSGDLASKLDTLLASPEKAREMGLRGRQHVAEHHALPKHLAALETLFQRCVDSRKAAG
jgi:glycosyltransferase involved in cell wall biosynthesis